jgi:hypothetical protein
MLFDENSFLHICRIQLKFKSSIDGTLILVAKLSSILHTYLIMMIVSIPSITPSQTCKHIAKTRTMLIFHLFHYGQPQFHSNSPEPNLE